VNPHLARRTCHPGALSSGFILSSPNNDYTACINGVSAQVIAVDTPAYVNSNNAAEAANQKAGHESKPGSYPPSNPAKDNHADEDAEPVHI
jgi:hypothetical protein